MSRMIVEIEVDVPRSDELVVFTQIADWVHDVLADHSPSVSSWLIEDDK